MKGSRDWVQVRVQTEVHGQLVAYRNRMSALARRYPHLFPTVDNKEVVSLSDCIADLLLRDYMRGVEHKARRIRVAKEDDDSASGDAA